MIQEYDEQIARTRNNKRLSNENRKWVIWRIKEHKWLLELENERLWRESGAETVEEVIEFWKKEQGILTT